MTSKLRIDLAQGLIEAEGSEDFIERIYADFKMRLRPSTLPSTSADINVSEDSTSKTLPKKSSSERPSANRKSRPPKKSLSIVTDINLGPENETPSLKEFYSRYRTKNSQERNLLFAYYLQTIRHVMPVTRNHIFTCYKHLGVRNPTNLDQSLFDTRHHQGWLDTRSLEDIKVTTKGEVHVEHDMPKNFAE